LIEASNILVEFGDCTEVRSCWKFYDGYFRYCSLNVLFI
jgi:hypothetical protein